MGPPGITWLTWIHSDLLGFTWFPLDSFKFIRARLDSLGLTTWLHLAPHGFTWLQMVSVGFVDSTWFHMASFWRTYMRAYICISESVAILAQVVLAPAFGVTVSRAVQLSNLWSDGRRTPRHFDGRLVLEIFRWCSDPQIFQWWTQQ